MDINKIQLFLLAKKKGKFHLFRPYLPANMVDWRWSFEFNSSPIVNISQNLVISVKRSPLPWKTWQMSGFKVALGRLEQWKIYPNLVTEYL